MASLLATLARVSRTEAALLHTDFTARVAQHIRKNIQIFEHFEPFPQNENFSPFSIIENVAKFKSPAKK